MNIGIVGCRRRDSDGDLALVRTEAAMRIRPGDSVVSGGCKKGADRFAEIIAKELCVPLILFLPDEAKLDPQLLKVNRRAAYAQINYARNTLIAEASHVLIACVASDRFGGTEDTIKKFRKKLRLTEREAIDRGLLILV